MSKIRLDVYLTDRGMAPSREKARSIIMSGIVFVDDQRVDKPGASIPEDSRVEVRGPALQYVSRGGLKLEKALDYFEVDPAGMTVLDAGASTGGFTDCLLQRGAKKVYAADVGYGQLAWSLRTDPRVVCMERTNVRHLTPEQLGEMVDLVVIDVSFISLKLILPAVCSVLKPEGRILCLIKPQFEAGKEKVGKKGVVRDRAVHREVLESFLGYAKENQCRILGITFSPIRGPEGNIEYLGHLRLEAGEDQIPDLAELVELSHGELDK